MKLRAEWVGIILVTIVLYSFAYFWPAIVLIRHGIEPTERVETEIPNGILTISVVLFAFWIPRIQKLKPTHYVAILALSTVQVLFIIYAGASYFGDYIRYRYITVSSLSSALTSLMVNAFTYLIFQLCQMLWRTTYE